ncbi:MFS transporter [Ilumatobacter sp.]|uniref:MFS transporter n=1 Tax=Ilumatobacter sp. TaxID=1967498 RepID=UPI003AF9FDF3
MTSDRVGSARPVDGPPEDDRSSPGALRRWLIGPPHVDRLTITHCVHAAAEAFFAVSMAGSIFFSVSPDAARPRVLLFLVVTLAPFLVMAPLVGPVVDRIRGGLASTLVASFVLRSVLALLLAENLRSLFLFPLAFGMLVLAKTYTIARNALVPSLVEDEHDLVAANARLSRTATFAGGIAAALAIAAYAGTSAAWSLRIGAVVYIVGAVFAWRVRSVAPRLEPVASDAFVELVRPDVSSAVWDMLVLRAALGFALFQFGFSLRAEGAAAWVLGALIFANGFGGFVGTVVSPLLRRRASERSMFTVALVSSALAVLAAGVALSRLTLIVAIFVLGMAVSVGRRALDATIQRQAPHARSGRVYAGIETLLEIAWVSAACLAVALRVATWIGMLALAAFLAVVTIVHLRRRGGLLTVRPLPAVPLPDRLLLRAETLAAHHFYDEAIVVALSALEQGPGPAPAPLLTHDERLALADPATPVAQERALDVIERVRHQLDGAG